MKKFLIHLIFTISLIGLSTNTSLSMGSSDDTDSSSKMDKNFIEGKKAIENNDFNKAIKKLKLSLSNDALSTKENANALNLIGFSYRKLKNYDKAFGYYAEALEIDPKHKPTLEYLGQAYLETNNLAKAESTYSVLKELCAMCKEKRSLNKAIKNYKKNNQ
ncbi:MAG: hypothetical protein CFH01_01001 [Alphaproteobacteria bacterium MarineAlpha2_Bin1]|nr:MAG: hypothetical protein CFH01_01001 [Alphaproteobacteria bacterium MarineAlpha2_Bin1]